MEEEREEHIWAVHVVLLDIVSYLNEFEFWMILKDFGRAWINLPDS